MKRNMHLHLQSQVTLSAGSIKDNNCPSSGCPIKCVLLLMS